MVIPLKDLPVMAEKYIRSEENMGTPREAIQVKLSPVKYPDLPADQIDDMIGRGIYANRDQIASSVWLEFCALAPHSGHETGARLCAMDEGLASRDELVQKITETIAQYNIGIQLDGL